MANLLKALPESLKSCYQDGRTVMGYEDTEAVMWKGYRFQPGFHPETAQYAMDHHKPKENEILIASCPKTGTTWTREIVRQLLYGDDEKLDLITRDLDPPMIYLATADKKKYNILHNMPIPRTYYATHLPAELVNVEKYKKKNMKVMSQILANEKCMEQYELLVCYDATKYGDSQKQLPLLMKMGEGYMEHILGWLPHIRDNENAMIMVYEEMIKNPQKGVREISDFLGLKKSDEEICKVCEKTAIGAVKKFDETSESAESQLHKAVGFVRKGGIGNWKTYFSPEQSAYIDAEVEKKLEGTGIKFIYE